MSVNKSLESQPLVYPQYINAYPAEDEISLVELWIALLKFKRVFAVSFLVLLVAAVLVITLFKSDNYTLSTSISIGQFERAGSLQDLQPADAVVSQLNQSQLPNLTRQFVGQHDIDLFETDVSNPKDTSLVIVQNKVKEKQQEIFTEFHQSIARTILNDHRELSRILNSKLEQALNAEKLALQKLKDPRELVKRTDFEAISLQQEKINLLKLTDTGYLDKQKSSFEKRIALYEEKIANLTQKNQQLRSQLESQKAGEAGSAQRTLIVDKISENELSINEAEEKKLEVEAELADFLIEIDLKAAKQKTLVESLESEIELIESNWKVEIEEKQAKVIELENQLQGNNTRVVSLAEMSLEPVGLTRNLAFIISVLLALFGAFFIMLVAMFREKVKEKMTAEA